MQSPAEVHAVMMPGTGIETGGGARGAGAEDTKNEVDAQKEEGKGVGV